MTKLRKNSEQLSDYDQITKEREKIQVEFDEAQEKIKQSSEKRKEQEVKEKELTERRKEREKEFEFEDFREAMTFITRISFEAEDQVHHPEIFNVYNTVNIALTSHDAGDKVTEKDVKLAKTIETISKNFAS